MAPGGRRKLMWTSGELLSLPVLFGTSSGATPRQPLGATVADRFFGGVPQELRLFTETGGAPSRTA